MWLTGGICICRHLFQAIIIYLVFCLWQHVFVFPFICLENDYRCFIIICFSFNYNKVGSKDMSHFLRSLHSRKCLWRAEWFIHLFPRYLLSPALGWGYVRCWGCSGGQDRCGPQWHPLILSYPEGVNMCCTGVKSSQVHPVTLGTSLNLYGSIKLRCQHRAIGNSLPSFETLQYSLSRRNLKRQKDVKLDKYRAPVLWGVGGARRRFYLVLLLPFWREWPEMTSVQSLGFRALMICDSVQSWGKVMASFVLGGRLADKANVISLSHL